MPRPRSPLARFARHLPFAVDDYDAARAAFGRWRETGAEADRRAVQVWAYGYVLAYFHARFERERTAGPADLDAAVTRAVDGAWAAFDAVRDPDKLPQYVSVVCLNGLRNHRSRRRETVPVEPWTLTAPAAEALGYDGRLVRHLLERAVGRLPPALRRVARLRLLGRAAYDEIARQTGRPIDSVRTYVSKSLVRLRRDPGLRALVDEGWLLS